MVARHDPHKYATLRQPQLIHSFDNLTGLTIVKNAAATAETRTEFFAEGTGSLYLNNVGSPDILTVDFVLPNGGIRFGPEQPVDMFLRAYLPTAWNGASIVCYLGNNSSFSTFCSGNLSFPEGKRNTATYLTGWNNAVFTRSTFTGGAHANLDTGAVLWTHMRIRLEIGIGPIHIDALWLNTRSRTLVVIEFDDAFESVNDNFPEFGNTTVWQYMQTLGLVGNICANGASVGTPTFLTVAELKTMQAAGWFVSSSLFNHESIQFKTDAQILTQYQSNIDWMIANGLMAVGGDGGNYVTLPTGEFDVDRHPALLRSYGAKVARSIQTSFANYPFQIQELHNLWSHGVTTSMPPSTVINNLDKAVKEGRHFLLYWHVIANPAVGPQDWLPASIKTVLDYIYVLKQTGLVDVVTYPQWYRRMFSPGR